MRTWTKLAAVSVVMGSALCLSAQVIHPIDTKPEGGDHPGCTYSGGILVGDGKKATTTSSTTCPQVVISPKQQAEFDALAKQAVADRQAQDQSNKDAAAKAAAEEKNAPTSGNQFAFPGETEVQKLNNDGTLAPAAPTPAPDAPKQQGSSSSGSPGLHDAGSEGTSSSSSSSSSNGYDPSALPENPTPGDAAPAPKRTRRKLPPVARQSDDEREAEDIKVGKFYMDDNNFRAAYGRAKDAIALQADDWEPHLMLADSARKLGMLDEAMREYKKTLELDPIPTGRKAAEKAIKEMGGNLSPNSIMP